MFSSNSTFLEAIHRITKRVEYMSEQDLLHSEIDFNTMTRTREAYAWEEGGSLGEKTERELGIGTTSREEMKDELFRVEEGYLQSKRGFDRDYYNNCAESVANLSTLLLQPERELVRPEEDIKRDTKSSSQGFWHPGTMKHKAGLVRTGDNRTNNSHQIPGLSAVEELEGEDEIYLSTFGNADQEPPPKKMNHGRDSLIDELELLCDNSVLDFDLPAFPEPQEQKSSGADSTHQEQFESVKIPRKTLTPAVKDRFDKRNFTPTQQKISLSRKTTGFSEPQKQKSPSADIEHPNASQREQFETVKTPRKGLTYAAKDSFDKINPTPVQQKMSLSVNTNSCSAGISTEAISKLGRKRHSATPNLCRRTSKDSNTQFHGKVFDPYAELAYLERDKLSNEGGSTSRGEQRYFRCVTRSMTKFKRMIEEAGLSSLEIQDYSSDGKLLRLREKHRGLKRSERERQVDHLCSPVRRLSLH